MKKIENFDTKKAYANGYSEEEWDLRWNICGIPLEILFNVNEIADKIDDDNETETYFVKGTRRPSTRGSRRKATAKAKRKAKRNEPFTYSLVDHGDYVIHKGNTHAWHPVWKKIDIRLRRHEGKNLCFNYEAEDATETEDIWLIPDEGWLEDYPEEAERLEELENQERIEWMQYLEDEVYNEAYDSNASATEMVPDTFMGLYIVAYETCVDYDYVTFERVIAGYAEAKAFYDQFDENDEWVGLYTTKKRENGIIETDKLIMEYKDE